MVVIRTGALITLVIGLLLIALWLATNPGNIPVLLEWIQFGFYCFLGAIFTSAGTFLAFLFFLFVVICVLVWIFG